MPFRTTLRAIAAVIGVALAVPAATASSPAPDVVSLDEARARFEAGEVILIDIREPREHATGVAAGARLLPMSQLDQRVAEIPADPGKPVYLICNSQNRSPAVLRALRNSGGYGHVRYVHGGMSEWARRGWPMVKPES
jgi:rhodanese-related sulfurtransferase